MSKESKVVAARIEKTTDPRPALRVKTGLRAGDGSSFHKDDRPKTISGPWLNNHSVGLRVDRRISAG